MNMQTGDKERDMRRLAAAALAVTAAVLLPACGGGDSGGGTSKAAWQKKNGALVSAYSRDLSDAVNTINQGQRSATTGSCQQVTDDANDLKKQAIPVPNSAVDTPLRKAIDLGLSAAGHCLKGAGSSGSEGAREVEAGQKDFADARKSMDAAEAAITAWS